MVNLSPLPSTDGFATVHHLLESVPETRWRGIKSLSVYMGLINFFTRLGGSI
jgi:hypothetical protein